MSNGLWSRDLGLFFSRIPPIKLSFLLNTDYPSTYKVSRWRRIRYNLSRVKGRKNLNLSFNIFERNPRSNYIFNLLEKYGFSNVRLSFSMLVVFGKSRNTYLNVKEYRKLAKFIVEFVRLVESYGVSVRMDNTIPVCMFSKEDLGELLLKGVLDAGRNFVCFPAIDIGPDLIV